MIMFLMIARLINGFIEAVKAHNNIFSGC